MKTKAPEFVPSVEEYKAAFQTIENKITEKQRSMLKEHYESFCHLTTATDLALLVGYKDFSAANVQYGKLGSMVSQALGLGSLGVITIVLMVPPQQGVINEWLWVMRTNVVEALEQLGWVDKKSHLFYPQDGVGSQEYIPD